MGVYYLMVEATPKRDNPESKEFGGAFVNCFVKADTPYDAQRKVEEYLSEQKWVFIRIEDIFAAQRERYDDEPDSLACYDDALQYGFGAIFYTWPMDESSVCI